MASNPALKKSVEEYFCAQSPVYWARVRRTLHGKPYVFWGDHPVEQRKFLEQPLNDTSQKKATKKARQVGLSENSVTEALWFADTHPHTAVLYTLPTEQFVSDFSNTRFQPVIDESPYLRKVTGGFMASGKRKIENVMLKRINASYLFMRSMGSERAGMGFPIDCAIWDEVDASSERHQDIFRAMLDASKYKWERALSTPTIPGKGITDIYNKRSDMKRWEVKCKTCGGWQFMDFPTCIDDFQGRWVFLCIHCHAVDSLDRANGRWVSTAPSRQPGEPDRDWSGYHIDQLIAPWFSAADIMNKKDTARYMQNFYNLVLGLEYVGENVLLNEQDILFCEAPEITREIAIDLKARGKVIHGVDWGDVTWALTGTPVVYKGREKLLITDIHKFDDKDINMHTRLVSMMIRTNDSFLTVLDAGYGKAQNLTLIKEFPGVKVWACQYVNTARGATARTVPIWTSKQSRVVVQKDGQLKYFCQSWKDRNILIPGYLKDDFNWKVFLSHMTSQLINRDEDDKGEIMETIEKAREDHLFHAGVYLFTAFERITKEQVRVGFI